MAQELVKEILGIDPGLSITGYGVIRINPDQKLEACTWGRIKTVANWNYDQKLLHIAREVAAIIDSYNPGMLAIEFPYHHLNVKTVIRLGQVQGVVLLAAAQKGLQIAEYSPREIKRAIVGYGAGTKDQVIYMVERILNLSEPIQFPDSADALAVAICHAHGLRLKIALG